MGENKRSTYSDIANEIRQEIISRHFSAGQNLPTENELAIQFQTSRVTIRKALNVLCNEHMIFSHQGKGYFVSKPEHNKYTMILDLDKPENTVKFNKVSIFYANEEIKNALSLTDDQLVIMIRRVIHNKLLPIACDEKYLPYTKGIPLIENEIKYADFPELVEKIASPFELNSDLKIYAENGNDEHTGLLCCRSDEPLLVVRRTIKNSLGDKIGYGVTYLRKEYGFLSARSGYSNDNS